MKPSPAAYLAPSTREPCERGVGCDLNDVPIRGDPRQFRTGRELSEESHRGEKNRQPTFGQHDDSGNCAGDKTSTGIQIGLL